MISVLRLSHRPERDKRATTHVFLTARALGAEKIFYTGIRDRVIEDGIAKVCERWGGKIEINFLDGYRSFLKNWPGPKVHLTMYGSPVQDTVKNIPADNLLVIVGGEKVPYDVYELADYNVGVTNQPHSEIAALAIFLDRLQQGKELSSTFANAKQVIVPSARGKNIKKID